MLLLMFLFYYVAFYCLLFFFLMRRRPPRSTQSRSSAASDVYKRQVHELLGNALIMEGETERTTNLRGEALADEAVDDIR